MDSLTEGTDRPGEFDAPCALASCALVPHDPPDQVVQQPQSERHTRTASDEEHAFVFTQIQAAPAIWAIDHHVHGHRHGVYYFLTLRTRDALLFCRGVLIERASPVTHHTGADNDGAVGEAGSGGRRIGNGERVRFEHTPFKEDAQLDVLACFPAAITVVYVNLQRIIEPKPLEKEARKRTIVIFPTDDSVASFMR